MKILIVDDAKDNRDVIKVILRDIEDIEIFEAENGKIAIEKTREIIPNLIIMDVMMPEMDGFEATKIIKKEYPNIIIMVLTASEDIQMERKMTQVGATCYNIKPIKADIFKYKIKNFVNLINLKNNSKSKLFNKNAINPFTKEIRNSKTFYTIENEDDMMDFGTWLLDFYHKFNPNIKMLFHKKLEFLYKIMIDTLKNQETLNIIIEDGFDELYINFETPKNFLLDEFDSSILSTIGEDLVFKNDYIHLKITPKKKDITLEIAENNDIKESIKINEYDRTLLRQSHINKVNAIDFVSQIEGSIIDEIHDLIDLEEHWSDFLDKYELKAENKVLIDISEILLKYSSVVNSLYSFMALSYALSSLGTFLRSVEVDNLDENINKKLVLFLRSVKSDLSDWRINIFEDKTAKDIHYLDSSLLSSCIQIEGLLSNKDIKDEQENELELF